ncbi:hypothetical protein PIROE2DRAFT_11307 [Piromyces sp. E2]|nr:hypothetical protein PIROE2DRAFT_11307 [Piromyces sp. E2]|eukprot:OUM62400.1 hypothetical protein PIROE2DRAFT_11307 [Piromyces sp. E2]
MGGIPECSTTNNTIFTSIDELKFSPEKLKNKNVYKSVERITKEVYLKKEIKVFNNLYECEMACRFLRTIEAFTLMKKLFEEGMLQFKHDADFDIELFNGETILNNAMDLKMNLRKKFLINKAESYIEIEKRENTMNTNTIDVESSIKLEEMKINVVTLHIRGLQEIKELFTKLRSSTNIKDIASYSGNISKICKIQNTAFSQYNNIIRRFPDAKDVVKIYILYLIDVMNKDELAVNKKALTSSSNSLGSIPHSEDYSSTSGMGRELRKKLLQKDKGDILNRNINIPASMKSIQYYVRQLSYNLMLNDYRSYGKNIGNLMGNLKYLNEMNMASVSNYMDIPTDTPLIVPVGEYAFDSYETNSLSDSYKKFVTNTKFCINREKLNENETVYDILYEPHFNNFDLVFSKCKEIVYNDILNTFKQLDIIVIGLEVTLFVIILCIGYIKNYEQIITDYEEKIENLCQSFDLDKEITETHSRHEKNKNYNNIKLIISFIFVAIYILIGGMPVLTAVSKVRGILSIAQKSSDRLPIIKSIQYYTYEVVNQDRSIFLDDEPNRILNDLIYKLEKIQEELKTGSYGGPTFDDYPFLESAIKENGCHRLEGAGGTSCDSIVYDSSYGFSEEVGTLPIDELIRTYIYYVKNFITNNEEGKYIHLPFTSKENIRIMYNQMFSDDFFKLQDSLMENIFGDIQYIDSSLMEYSKEVLSNFVIFHKIYEEKIKEMDTLVSFVFLVPQAVVNKNEKYKRFLETTQTDE